MAVFTVFFQMLALMIMIGAGCLLTKKGMMDERTSQQISKMIISLFSPMLSISCAAGAVGQIPMHTMMVVGLIAAGMFLFFIFAGMLLTPFFEKDQEQKKIFQMMFVFSNLGFIGIPVVSSILGPEYVVYVTEFNLVYNIFFYTYGMMVMDGGFSLSSLKSMLNPGTVCGVVSVIIIVCGVQLPDFINTAVTYLGNVASPMALVVVGFSLAHADLKKIFRNARLYLFAFVKLLVLPFLMFLILRLFTDDRALLPVCMIMFGMPVGNMPLMLCNQRGIDGTACSAAVIMTTIFCVFTVPILIVAAG